MQGPSDAPDVNRAASPRQQWWGLPLGVLVLVGAAVAALHADPLGGPAGVVRLDEALFEPLDGAGGSAGVQGPGSDVALPHDWSVAHAGVMRARYRLRFERPDLPGAGGGLYLPGVNTRAIVRINDERLGAGGDVPGLASRFWLVPLYRSIPSALLVEGENTLEIELSVEHKGNGFLAPAYVGPEALLRPAFEWRRFLQVTGIQVLVIAMLSLGAFLALLSAFRRKDSSYFWFAVVVWIFAFGFWNLLAIETRIPKPSYRWVGAVTMAWMVAAIVVFVHRVLGERHPRGELALGAAVALGSIYFAITLGTPAFDAAVPIWGALVLCVGLYPASRVWRRHASHPGRDTALLMTSGLLILFAGLHDVGLVNGALGAGHDFAIQHAAAASIGLLSLLFVMRFVDALDTSEALSAELAERVEEKAAELEAGHARLRVLEREQAVTHERERILGEIHDGMGSQLVSALALVRGGEGDADETADAIQSALDDMRLMLDSLDDIEGDLGTLLGNLRQRIGRRLERGGLSLQWRITDTPQPRDFGPEAALQVMRVAQEAMTNVIKHAGATTIRVSTSTAGEGSARVVLMEIADDGRGIDSAAGRVGRGLAHMRTRADRIGASLEIDGTPEGTTVRLVMPAPE